MFFLVKLALFAVFVQLFRTPETELYICVEFVPHRVIVEL